MRRKVFWRHRTRRTPTPIQSVQLLCFGLPYEHKDISASRTCRWIDHGHCSVSRNSCVNRIATLDENRKACLSSEVVSTSDHTTSTKRRLFGEHSGDLFFYNNTAPISFVCIIA